AAIAVAILLGSAAAGFIAWAQKPEQMAQYYVWRLRKDNATDYDHFRARRRLPNYLSRAAYQELAAALRIPNLPVKTADNILGLMLECRGTTAANDANLSGLLMDALRTENPDIRQRIYKVLMYLADEQHLDTTSMQAWQPDPKD